MPEKVLSLCSGIGGFEIAIAISSIDAQPVAFCEQDLFCQEVLKHRYPGIPIFNDLKKLTCEQLNLKGITRIDGIVGGLPCQPFSGAGVKKGSKDDRNLFPEFYRLLRTIQPKWAVIENVPGLLTIDSGRFFGGILRTLWEIGYDARWQTLSCAQLCGTHRRERLWIIITNSNKK